MNLDKETKNMSNEEKLKKQLKVERATNVVMAIILIACVAAMIFMMYKAATKTTESSNGTSTVTDVETVEPGEESVETIEFNGKEYQVTVPATLDFTDYSETNYINENGRYVFNTADYVSNPDFELPEFDGKKEDYVASESEVDEMIDELLDSYGEFTEYEDENYEIANGDTVIVTYSAYYNGVEMPSIADTETSVVVGSENYIPGFEEALIGHKKGEEFTSEITFPDTYTVDGTATGDPATAEDADGNEVVLTSETFEFKFEIVQIGTTVIPELTDDWVASTIPESSGLSIDTVDKLRAYYECVLYYNALITDVNSYIVDEVMPTIEFNSVPDELMEFVFMNGLYQYYNYGQSIGLDIDTTVYTYTGMNVHDFLVDNLESTIDQALQLMTWDLVYDKVAELGAASIEDDDSFHTLMNEVMGIELTQEEFDNVIETNGIAYSRNYATQYSIADFLVKE